MNNRLIKITAAAAAVVAIALGGIAIGRTGSGSSAAATGGGAQGGPPNGIQGGRPGGGNFTAVTGTAATKVKDAALAKYPGATIEQIVQLQDGSYMAHVMASSGEVHLLVSKDFKVTGTAQGRPGQGGGGMPPGGAPQGGAAPQGGTTAPSSSQSS